MNRLLPLFPLLFAWSWLSANPLEDQGRPVATTDPLSPEETAKNMEVPDGFRVRAFAGEPDVVQPIAFTIDDRGRLWVVENTNYPKSPGEPKDKILILEDTNGDGLSDKRSVFYDKLTFASAIAIGHGGVWVGAPPNLLFFPREDDSQDTAAGEPEIVLDGWGAQDTHETLNNFIWGPDGWLYGTHGIFTHSKVGKPGTPDDERVRINAGLFRYHPVKEEFELYTEGGSNQWGLDWDDHGRGFFAACVIPHMWQAIQGGRYHRQAGQHFNPHTYEDIRTIADFNYEKRAYCGAMIYLGDSWPQEYRNTFFFNDIHMNKLRNEKFVRNGSGTKSEKNGDFMASKDPWFRGLSPQYGPDGSVFVSDWYDRVPCHQQMNYTDRTNGRIYKISHGSAKPVNVDMQKASDEELVNYQLHTNDWYVRTARRILAERGPKPEVHMALAKILANNPDETRKLRALWALHVTGGLTEEIAAKSMESPMEYLRAWTIQLINEDGEPTDAQLKKMAELATNDASPVVRLHLASAAGRIAIDSRWPILEALVAHEKDANDPNIPLLVWYAAEPAVAADVAKAANLLGLAKIPKLQEFISRRMAAMASN
jgi:glucose/arabinose dehydrogenase